LLFLLLSGLLAIYGGYYLGNEYARHSFQPRAIALLQPPKPLAEFQLTDQQSAPFRPEQLKGRWTLLLPGYLQAGEETAALLGLASRIHNRLATPMELQRRFRVALVSMDPTEDTPERLRDFLRPYGQPFVGLTGDAATIQALAAQLGWVSLRVTTEDGGYRVDHSTSLALINPAGELVGLFTGLLNPATIAQDIQQLAAF